MLAILALTTSAACKSSDLSKSETYQFKLVAIISVIEGKKIHGFLGHLILSVNIQFII
jgi:hypothetical protein